MESSDEELWRVIGNVNTFAENMEDSVERNGGFPVGTVENLRLAKDALENAISQMLQAVELLEAKGWEVAAGWMGKCLDYNAEALEDIKRKLEQFPPE